MHGLKTSRLVLNRVRDKPLTPAGQFFIVHHCFKDVKVYQHIGETFYGIYSGCRRVAVDFSDANAIREVFDPHASGYGWIARQVKDRKSGYALGKLITFDTGTEFFVSGRNVSLVNQFAPIKEGDAIGISAVRDSESKYSKYDFAIKHRPTREAGHSLARC